MEHIGSRLVGVVGSGVGSCIDFGFDFVLFFTAAFMLRTIAMYSPSERVNPAVTAACITRFTAFLQRQPKLHFHEP